MLDSAKHFSRLPAALEPLKAIDRWVLWRFEVVDGKRAKVPYAPSGLKAKTNDATTWSSYAAVIAAFDSGDYNGIGFCLRNSSICAFDLDHCHNPETGLVHLWANTLVHERAKSYAEITPSGEGLRIIGFGTGPRLLRKQKVDAEMSCESYRDCEKYITISGNQLNGSANQLINIDAAMDEVVQELDANSRSSTTADADAETDESSPDTEELPRSLTVKLHIPNLGAGREHAGYDTRSALTLAFIIEALRARISAATIKAACVDTQHRGRAVFEHCQENGGRNYVARQIKQARIKMKESLDAEVATINKTHALVLAGNRASMMKFEKIAGKDQFRLLQVGAFKIWFANQQITVGKKVMTLGDFWISHRDRREYHGIEFEPTGGRDGYYNLWRGFAVEPREGDCSKFLAHLKDNVARGNEFHYTWILGWFAQIFQQLDIKVGTSVCLRGKQGVGKTKVGEVIGSLLGRHYELVSDPRYITGQFNSHMAGLLLIHADEAFWAGDKRAEGKLKNLVTGLTHQLEFKNVDPISVRNHIRLFVTGNQEWLVPAGFGERRFAVFDVGEEKIKNHDYFAAIDAEMNQGGREALLHHLLSFDLSQVNLRVIPSTEALFEQIVESATPEQAWWLDTLKRGELPRGVNEADTCPKRSLFRRYVQHAQLQGARRKAVETKIGMFLTKYVGQGLKADEKRIYTIHRGIRDIQETGWIYKFPPLWECRQRFASEVQQVIAWGPDAETTQWDHEAVLVYEDDDAF